jgi:hypothetical protein
VAQAGGLPNDVGTMDTRRRGRTLRLSRPRTVINRHSAERLWTGMMRAEHSQAVDATYVSVREWTMTACSHSATEQGAGSREQGAAGSRQSVVYRAT